eukprot:1328728-Rhodomonas_salina.3
MPDEHNSCMLSLWSLSHPGAGSRGSLQCAATAYPCCWNVERRVDNWDKSKAKGRKTKDQNAENTDFSTHPTRFAGRPSSQVVGAR